VPSAGSPMDVVALMVADLGRGFDLGFSFECVAPIAPRKHVEYANENSCSGLQRDTFNVCRDKRTRRNRTYFALDGSPDPPSSFGKPNWTVFRSLSEMQVFK
jgi:hypothetical protein